MNDPPSILPECPVLRRSLSAHSGPSGPLSAQTYSKCECQATMKIDGRLQSAYRVERAATHGPHPVQDRHQEIVRQRDARLKSMSCRRR